MSDPSIIPPIWLTEWMEAHEVTLLSVALAAEIKARGFRSKLLAASCRTDTVEIKGDFPHKTVATRAGLG